LTSLTTTRSSDPNKLQALNYAYDPVGNITRIVDKAQQTIFFKNQIVEPSNDYVYDALYRLIQAKGRESIGLASVPQTTWDDSARMGQALPLPSDAQALRNYTETYQYDSVGNILALIHVAANGNWTRNYAYDQPNSPPTDNRLTSTTVGAGSEVPYSYDAHGNMIAMPHLTLMASDFKDQLHATQQRVSNGPVETTYYVYDSTGQRVRKVTETANGAKANEQIYLGAYEVYREHDATGTAVTLERDTLHVMDDKRRIALLETKTIDQSTSANLLPDTAIRYQHTNHLESACLELDENASVISYEEYYPYGSTSYQSGSIAAETSLKRYRYTGKERDEENRFYYHGARYYAPWLGRWTSCDPLVTVDGPNLFSYSRNNPIRFYDPSGLQNVPAKAGTPAGPVTDEELNALDEESDRNFKLIQQRIESSHHSGVSGIYLNQPPPAALLGSNAKSTIEAIQSAPVPDRGPDTQYEAIRKVGSTIGEVLYGASGLWLPGFIAEKSGIDQSQLQNISDTLAASPVGVLPKLGEVASGLRLTLPTSAAAETLEFNTARAGGGGQWEQLSLFENEPVSIPEPKLLPNSSKEIPYRIDIGEVKSINWSVSRTINYQGKFIHTEGLNLHGGVQASIRYTADNALLVDLRELGGMEAPIGETYRLELDPVEFQKATQGLKFGTSAYGNKMEGLAIQRVFQATGQVPVLQEPGAGGADFLPVQLNLRIPGYTF
jgi:RHS repeat-associated protein